jgi:hypothetical protein
MRYDPNVAPSTTRWLALDEGERMVLVEKYHDAHDATLENRRVHAAIHAAVETQLAMKWPSVVGAVARLGAEGLDRHDVIHAIGAVLAGHMWQMLRDDTPGDPNAEYFAALDRLTADSWRRDHG